MSATASSFLARSASARAVKYNKETTGQVAENTHGEINYSPSGLRWIAKCEMRLFGPATARVIANHAGVCQPFLFTLNIRGFSVNPPTTIDPTTYIPSPSVGFVVCRINS